MSLRLFALTLLLAASACSQPPATLPRTGGPTAEGEALARSTCPNASFVSVDPVRPYREWYRC